MYARKTGRMVARTALRLLVYSRAASSQPQNPRNLWLDHLDIVATQAFSPAFASLSWITVLNRGVWWHSEDFPWALMLLLLLATVALLWAAMLRRQVSAKNLELELSLQVRRKAQQFDVARNEVLESIAQNAPAPESLEKLALTVEQQIPGSLCVIVLRPDTLSPGTADSPLLVGPSLPEETQTALLAALPPSVSDYGCLSAEKGVPTTEMKARLLPVLRGAGMHFEEVHSSFVLSATGFVSGLLLVFLSKAGFAQAAELNLMAWASRVASLAADHWSMHERLLHGQTR